MGRIVEISDVLLELGISASPSAEEYSIAEMAIDRAEAAVRRYLRYDPALSTRTEYYPMTDYDYRGRQAVWEVQGTQAVLRRLAEATTAELQLRHLPIRASTPIQVWIDYDGRSATKSGAFAAETLKTEGEDYWANYDGVDSGGSLICRDGILRSAGLWPTQPGSVKVTYTAGYSKDELRGRDTVVDAAPIWEAALDEAVRRAKRALATKKKAGAGFVAGAIASERLGDYSYTLDGALSRQLFGADDLTASSRERLDSFANWGWAVAS